MTMSFACVTGGKQCSGCMDCQYTDDENTVICEYCGFEIKEDEPSEEYAGDNYHTDCYEELSCHVCGAHLGDYERVHNSFYGAKYCGRCLPIGKIMGWRQTLGLTGGTYAC